MSLILRVESYRGAPAAPGLAGCFDAAGGTLGRGTGNALVLEDPSKYISRTHASVSLRDGAYYLRDSGSNPSVVNERPLGNGREIALAAGDRIAIGDYLLVAEVAEGVTVPRPTPAAAVVAHEAPAPPSLPAAPAPGLAMPGPPLIDVLPDALAGARILSGTGFDAGLDSAGGLSDPLGLNLFAQAPPAGALAAALGPAFRGAESDHVAPQLQAFSATAPSAGLGSLVIPADYDPLADAIAPRPAPSAPAPAVVPTAMPEPASVASAAPAYAPPPAVINLSDMAQLAASPSPSAVFSVPPSTVSITAPPVPDAPAAAPAAQPLAPVADSVLLQALLDGLGIPQLRSSRSPQELVRLAGEMLRAATGGTMAVLMARALTKRESHIDMTMIAPRSNNPLKFFPDPDSALTQMLGSQSAGYLPPVTAIDGAFDDLKAHEMAVLAGMRAALGAVVQRFDPARIEQRVADPGRLDRLLPAARKARMWDRLVEVYAELARDADEDLQRLFGEKFSDAYEEQIERLRVSR